MSDQDAFLARIVAEPDDDTARLVFADWLDEHGEPERAEFIRLQVRASVAGEAGSYWTLKGNIGKPTRFKDLVRAALPWEYPPVMGGIRGKAAGYVQASTSNTAVLWRRGFIEGVLLSGVSLGPVLAELKRWPVREVRLTNEPHLGVCRRLCPGWSHGTSFRYDIRCDEILRTLLTGSGGFPNLRYAGFESGSLSRRLCPFQLVSIVNRPDQAAA